MTEPASPAAATLAFDDQYDPVPHTHPVPRSLKSALVVFSAFLLLSGCAVLYTVARVATVVQEQRAAAYTTCVTSRDASANNRDFYSRLADRLGPNADVVLREQIQRQAATAAKNATKVCTR